MGVQCLGATLAPLRTRALGSKSDAGDRARGRVRRAPRVALVPRAALAGVARVHAHRVRGVSRGRTPRHVPSAASGDAPAPEEAREPAEGSIDGVADALDVIARDIGGGSSSSSGKTLLVALVALVSIHVRDPGWGVWNVIRVVGSLVLGAGLAFKGYRGGSLDTSGAVGAALVGWGTLYAGVRFGVVLGAFFFLSSAMTRVGGEIKKIDENHVPGKASGARNWIQVAANGLVPTFLAMSYSFATGGPEYLLGVNNAFETPLAAAFIGYYGCCCGDTWSSELGVLSERCRGSSPRGKSASPGRTAG